MSEQDQTPHTNTHQDVTTSQTRFNSGGFHSESVLKGTVERITFHNPENGWTVLKVKPIDGEFKGLDELKTVVIHQSKVFPGATMEFRGKWIKHSKYGEQLKVQNAFEIKPSSSAALEKYLGSGLIKGVGPATAKRIVGHFKEKTLDVFESHIDRLLEVPGIARKKLVTIQESWNDHKAIRDVMIFLQTYGVSTLYAVKIFKRYGEKSIDVVKKNPYRLAKDIFGIGFYSADKIALALGIEADSSIRLKAALRQVLDSSRDQGHCFLTFDQIEKDLCNLIQFKNTDRIQSELNDLVLENEIISPPPKKLKSKIFYSPSLYYDEHFIAERLQQFSDFKVSIDQKWVTQWVSEFCQNEAIQLSQEQQNAVIGIASSSFSVLTGGPGCGKTTTTKAIVKLFVALQKKVLLAAPTGRAAQRMSEVIGLQSKTIHRLLEFGPGGQGFQRDEDYPLDGDVIIVDECSMLDVHLMAALLRAIPGGAQVLFIGDPDQLPSVGAGQILRDIIESQTLSCFHLTQIFRQAQESLIIKFAHLINKGETPRVPSPIENPNLWGQSDALFLDSVEATQEQIRFAQKIKRLDLFKQQNTDYDFDEKNQARAEHEKWSIGELEDQVMIPEKFKRIDFQSLHDAPNIVEELKVFHKKINPYSTIHYGLDSVDTVVRLCHQTLPKHFPGKEIQVLTPQVRGSLGALNLNEKLQTTLNPEAPYKNQIKIGTKIFRVGDRVIQTRNNYDLNVFNGDIGKIDFVDSANSVLEVRFNDQTVKYAKEDLGELNLAYSITIHKSQGSEFDIVIIPVSNQHYRMLFRNLIYTGLTRGKKLAVFVGSRKALSLACRNINSQVRQSQLADYLVYGLN